MQSRTTGGSTVSFLWDPATSPSRLLVSGADLLVYGLGPLYRVNGTTVTTYARDGQKSIRAELNGAAVTGSWRYRAYGDVAQNSGSATPSLLGYAGQLLDPSGLYYLRARWYDASSARFVSRDPLAGTSERPVTLNAFIYGAASPAQRADPSGLRDAADDVNEGGNCDEQCIHLIAIERDIEISADDPVCTALCALMAIPAFAAPFNEKWAAEARAALARGQGGAVQIDVPDVVSTSYLDVIQPGSGWQRMARYEERA